MWSSRLFWKFFLAYCALFLIQTAAIVTLFGNWQRESLQGGVRQRLENTARLVAGVIPEALQGEDRTQLQAWATRMGAETGLRLTILSPAGTVLADTNEDALGRRDTMAGPDVQQALAAPGGVGSAVLVYSPSEPFRQAYSLRIGAHDAPLGLVRVLVSLEETDRQVELGRVRLLQVAFIGFLLLVLLTYFMLARIVRPLTQVIEGAEAIARGRYDRLVTIASRDELGTLGGSFNTMALELRRRIEELQSRGEQLATVLGSMIEGVIAVDANEKVLFANEAAGLLLDFRPHKALGRPFWEAVRNPVVQRSVQETLQPGEPPKRQEFEVIRTRRIVAMHTTRLPGRPCPGVVLVLHDVTELRRLENLRQEFVANVSHELKTPLTSIQAYAETLLEGALDDPENNVRFVRRIEEQAERLHQLIVDVLSLARIEQNPEGLELTSIPLPDVVRECLQQHLPTAEGKRVVLTADMPDSLDVRAEREGLRTILDNLVTNAVKYTPAEGRVTIRCRAEDRHAVIEVTDTGIGIAPEHQPRVFERFYRADAARSRDQGGTGLGLSIVKHLVQAFGGTVAVVSRVGQGSTFTVHLPRATPSLVPVG